MEIAAANQRLILRDYESCAAELGPQVEKLVKKGYDHPGLQADEVRKQSRNAIIEKVMESKFVNPGPVTAEDKAQWLLRNPKALRTEAQVKFSSITVPGTTAKRREALAKKIHASLLNGGDFEALAREHSSDGSGKNGGRWGWVDQKDLAIPFLAVISKLPVGGVSEIVSSSENFYIFRVDDRDESDLKPQAERDALAEKGAKAEKRKQVYDQWIAGLRTKYATGGERSETK